MKSLKIILAGSLLALLWTGCDQDKKAAPGKSPTIQDLRNAERTDNPAVEDKIDDLLSQMTLEEKIGQMTQINNSVIATNAE